MKEQTFQEILNEIKIKQRNEELIRRIIQHEGMKLDPYKLTYKDKDGNLVKESFYTGGVGHRMTKGDLKEFNFNWSNKRKKSFWIKKFKDDLLKKTRELRELEKKYDLNLNEDREGVLLEMLFQLGKGGVEKFPSFLKAISGTQVDLEEAYWQMITRNGEGTGPSAWYTQTPSRAKKLAEIMRNS